MTVLIPRASQYLCDTPDIAASGNNVYITFADNKTGFADAYIMTSNDNGKTFNPAVKLTYNTNSTVANKTLMSQMNSYKVKPSPYKLKIQPKVITYIR